MKLVLLGGVTWLSSNKLHVHPDYFAAAAICGSKLLRCSMVIDKALMYECL